MTHSRSPDLSVVIVTPADYRVIRKTIRHLAAQTVPERLEIVIGATSEANLAPMESELKAFHSHKIVELGEVKFWVAARATSRRSSDSTSSRRSRLRAPTRPARSEPGGFGASCCQACWLT